jgi:hypothetical protein
MFHAFLRHLVGLKAFGQVADRFVEPLPEVPAGNLKRGLDVGGNPALDSFLFLFAKRDPEVTCIGKWHHLGLEGELGTKFIGSRIVLGPEQAAEPHLGLLHEGSELARQSVDSRRELVR